MTTYSRDKDINALVHELLEKGWTITKGKHWQLYTPDRFRKLAVPSTPSCPRASMNFKADVRRLERQLVLPFGE